MMLGFGVYSTKILKSGKDLTVKILFPCNSDIIVVTTKCGNMQVTQVSSDANEAAEIMAVVCSDFQEDVMCILNDTCCAKKIIFGTGVRDKVLIAKPV
jgi:hypothetical protein